MKNNLIIYLVLGLSTCVGVFFGITQSQKSKINTEIPSLPEIADETNIPPVETEEPPKIEENVVIEPVKAKAVYLTGWTCGSATSRQKTIENMKANGFNAIVIDIKDESGQLSYTSTVEQAIQAGASKNMIRDISSVIQEFKDNGIYVIGRIVTFKDPTYANANQNIAYKYSDGTTWKDSSGKAWPNPYNREYWEYPISLAKEAVSLGFEEIQFDYVRFPSSEGRTSKIDIAAETLSKSEIINEFLTKAMTELKPLNVIISVDVFGITTKKDGDFEHIGQDYSAIAQIVDVVCPMVYPSHYGYGEYGIAKPDLEPYNIVYKSLMDTYNRTVNLETTKLARVRPYLQDFTASWLKSGNYINYGTEQVKAQIKATYDAGFEEFTLWDPNNKYCYEALPAIPLE